MRLIENHCVDCGLPCMGKSCPYMNVPVDYCDECTVEIASYNIDGEDLCKICAQKLLQEQFDDLTILEKAKALGVTARDIE